MKYSHTPPFTTISRKEELTSICEGTKNPAVNFWKQRFDEEEREDRQQIPIHYGEGDNPQDKY